MHGHILCAHGKHTAILLSRPKILNGLKSRHAIQKHLPRFYNPNEIFPHIEFEDVDGDARERAGPGEPDEVAGADVGGKKGRPDLRDC